VPRYFLPGRTRRGEKLLLYTHTSSWRDESPAHLKHSRVCVIFVLDGPLSLSLTCIPQPMELCAGKSAETSGSQRI
jgi:hypothetical protein